MSTTNLDLVRSKTKFSQRGKWVPLRHQSVHSPQVLHTDNAVQWSSMLPALLMPLTSTVIGNLLPPSTQGRKGSFVTGTSQKQSWGREAFPPTSTYLPQPPGLIVSLARLETIPREQCQSRTLKRRQGKRLPAGQGCLRRQ
uniref:Uncharacterized protein n=1 Tax=Myotis myotis TaxID=51298 RepID=A0A7J8AMM5_MYOMY|nr:hypothetical protein mMyoMyo1_007995 [Myotis myotis]